MIKNTHVYNAYKRVKSTCASINSNNLIVPWSSNRMVSRRKGWRVCEGKDSQYYF
jgi:hypothetical protein